MLTMNNYNYVEHTFVNESWYKDIDDKISQLTDMQSFKNDLKTWKWGTEQTQLKEHSKEEIIPENKI